MSDNPKAPVWPWIVALLIGLPALYVASFGPACWLSDRDVLPNAYVNRIYRPLTNLALSCGLENVVRWYGELLPTPQPLLYSNYRIPKAQEILFEARSEQF